MSASIWRGMASLCTLAMVPALGSALLQRPDWNPQIEEIGIESARQLPRALWIDARPRAEFEQEHIPTALPLTLAEWETNLDAVLDAWKPALPTIVYCGGANCDTSREVALRLKREAQIENLLVLKGGWPAWKASQ